jgi:hypothetical protein
VGGNGLNPISILNTNSLDKKLSESKRQASYFILEIEGKIENGDIEGYVNNVNNHYINSLKVNKGQIIGKNLKHIEDKFSSMYYQIIVWFLKNTDEDSLTLYVNKNDLEIVLIDELKEEKYDLWEIVCSVVSREQEQVKLFILVKDVNKELTYIMEKMTIKDIKSYNDIIKNLSDVISNLSHAWRQPLNNLNFSIINFIDELAEETNDSTVREEYYNEIWQIIKNLSGEIEKFKAFFEMDYQTDLFDVKEYLDLVFEILEEKIIKESIAIDTDINEQINIYGSHNEFLQIMYCILFDLIEHCKEVFDIKNRKINIQVTRDSEKVFMKIEPVYDREQYPDYELSINHLSMFQNIIHRRIQGSIELINEKIGHKLMIEFPLGIKEE